MLVEYLFCVELYVTNSGSILRQRDGKGPLAWQLSKAGSEFRLCSTDPVPAVVCSGWPSTNIPCSTLQFAVYSHLYYLI